MKQTLTPMKTILPTILDELSDRSETPSPAASRDIIKEIYILMRRWMDGRKTNEQPKTIILNHEQLALVLAHRFCQQLTTFDAWHNPVKIVGMRIQLRNTEIMEVK